MSDDVPFDDFTEKIKILSTDDEKIKSFGEIFTNDTSREILQLLFNEELSANQIAQRINVSLQLVKYHINKLQDLGVVKISKIEKNSKSKDMKIYSAIKFSIVIVPPKLSKKTKESKLLVRSFRHIYKVTGFGIATGLSGLLSLSQLPEKSVSVDIIDEQFYDESQKSLKTISQDDAQESFSASDLLIESEPQDFTQYDLEIVEAVIDSNVLESFDLFFPFVITTIIFGGLTIYYFIKSKKLF